jgi:hypothetical protein
MFFEGDRIVAVREMILADDTEGLVRTFMVRTASAHSIRAAKSPDSSGWSILTSPWITWPVEPSTVMNYKAKTLTVGGVTLKAGDVITVDGSTGQVIQGEVKMLQPVRHRPIPSAPNLRAARASAGVSALVRTFMVRTASAHSIRAAK